MHSDDFIPGMGAAMIHAGNHLNAEHAHLTPIYATSTFVFDSAEQGMDRFSVDIGHKDACHSHGETLQ